MTVAAITAREARKQLYEVVRQDNRFEVKARDALELGREYLNADNGHLTRIDPETDHWEAMVSTDQESGTIPEGLKLDLETTYCRKTLDADDQIALHDAPNQGWADDIAFETHGFHCYHGTKIVLDGESYGTVCFVAEDPRKEAFSDGETMFAELIARLLERELERERHEAELTRQANLSAVLNRVLRHNIRNEMSVIRGFTELMTDQLDDERAGKKALESIDELIELSQKARELDEVVAADGKREPTPVVDLVEKVRKETADKYPQVTLTLDAEAEITASILPSFERAIEELLENAAKHAGPTPTISVQIEPVPNAVEIRIRDDGPGLAKSEIAVLDTGTETQLSHGSGLGLWLAYWIVTSHDGTIDATVTDEGTEMTVSIPRNPETDIDERLTKLTRARDQYRAAFEEASDAMVMVNDDAKIVDANPAASGVYGLSSRELLGRELVEFFPETFDFESTWQEFQTNGTNSDVVPVVGADDAERQVEYSAVTDIVPGQHLIVSRDVTERVEREAELRTKTEAIETAPVGITLTDPNREDNPIVYVNEEYCELTGYDEDEILGRNCRFMQGPETNRETVRRIRTAIENEEPVSTVIRNYRKDGTAFWNRLTIAPVTEDGAVTNWVGFQEDVTGRIERERELEETTTRLETLIDVSPDPIIAVDSEGTVWLWNDAAEDVFGYTTDQVVGEQIQSLGFNNDEQASKFTERLKRVLAGERVENLSVQRKTTDGQTVHLILSAAPLYDEHGDVTGMMAVGKSITESVETELPQ